MVINDTFNNKFGNILYITHRLTPQDKYKRTYPETQAKSIVQKNEYQSEYPIIGCTLHMYNFFLNNRQWRGLKQNKKQIKN